MNEPTPIPDTRLAELRADEAMLPPAPWELWTACSFRRITGPDGREGGVLHAYNQRSDGHPDLSMPEDQLFALVRLRNALPVLLSDLTAARTRVVELEEALNPFLPITINETRDYAELTFGGHQTQAMTMSPAEWRALSEAALSTASPAARAAQPEAGGD